MTEARQFQSVFEKISLSPGVREAFYNTQVNKLKIIKKEKRMEIGIHAGEIIDGQAIDNLKKELLHQLPGIVDIEPQIKFFVDREQSKEEILSNYWDNIVFFLAQQGPICKGVMRDAVWELAENQLVIRVKNNAAYYMAKKEMDRKVRKNLQEQLGIELSVVFKNVKISQEEREHYEMQLQRKEAELMQEVMAKSREAAEARADGKADAAAENIARGILIGKPFSGEQSRIIDAKIEGERVIIQGHIFNIEPKEIKGDRYIVAFDITDHSDSTTAKFFTDKSTFDKSIKEKLKTGVYLRLQGDVQFDKYAKELIVMARNVALATPPPERIDNAEEKRVELHLHTQMSSMDGVTPVKKFIERAGKWGHKAIAITDHGVVQAYPDAMDAAKKAGIKVLYGVEAYLVDDLGNVVMCPKGQSLQDTFVVFDIETTGLSKEKDMITEIGAVKVVNGEITDTFSTFVNPHRALSEEIVKLTGITDEMLKDAPDIGQVLPQFLEFAGNSVLVAHNAGFDVGFIRINAKRLGCKAVNNTVLDTLELARCLLPQLNKHKLNLVAEEMGVELNGHHRAVNDAQATAEIFMKFIAMLEEKEITKLEEINVFASQTVNYKKLKAHHAIILAKNYTGLRNLYELISKSHIDYFFRRPRIPKSEFIKRREGLMIGSACEAGELYRALLDGKPEEYIEELVNFYDYLEIQPVGNNMFMIESPKIDAVNSIEDIKQINRKIVELGESHNKLVVATCDVHFIDPDDACYRKIIMAAEGFSDADKQAPLYFRTTDEMLKEFQYLGAEKAKELVITNPNLIADSIEAIKPIPDETYPPVIPGAEEEIRKITMDKAYSIYGNPLPEIVEKRLEKELNSIIKNGFSVMYIIAQKLVWKSMEDGYLVGSRGSVGSSFVATMSGITEVNPLPAHYVCPNCKFSDFDSEEVKKVTQVGGSGCDMPDKDCPICGARLIKDGHDIPFETFLGFDGDKEPDIDLNFSGEYQQQAHAYTEVLFGKGHVFKAGTIGTLADKTAYGFVKKYLDERGLTLHNAEINRLIGGCTGVKRTTGQHPGGLMIVPNDHDIHEFCPIQRPANDMNATVTTTHFDYHSISGRLLKLDLLGHDDPTVIRMLYDLTGINPQSVPLDDKDTMSLFESPKALGVTAEQIDCETGTLGIPEFGTKFTRRMLLETKPKTFSDLLRISGLSHGTDVWTGNAQTLIADGIITLKDTISTRDSIMGYLINKGVPNKTSFKIMEKVRKGKGLAEEDIAIMKENNVPDWYIKSCQKIKYMFPKAHAAAYVMMAYRIAYFKINYPLAYYAAYFTIRACDDFDYSTMCKGIETAKAAIQEINAKGKEATTKEKNKLTVLEIIVEYYARGFHFDPIDLYESDARKFRIVPGGLQPPFNSLQGLGVTAAQSIVEGRKEGEFNTIEEFKNRTSVGKTLIELLKENQVLKGIPETNQLTLF